MMLMVEPTKEDSRISRRAGAGSREEIAHLYTSTEVTHASDSHGSGFPARVQVPFEYLTYIGTITPHLRP